MNVLKRLKLNKLLKAASLAVIGAFLFFIAVFNLAGETSRNNAGQAKEGAILTAVRVDDLLSPSQIISLRARSFDERKTVLIPPYTHRLAVAKNLIEESGLGSVLSPAERTSTARTLAGGYLNLIVAEPELQGLLVDFKTSGRLISELDDFLQNRILDYFAEEALTIIREVRDGAPAEEQQVHELFMAGIWVYKFPLTRHLVAKRKKLLTYYILLNVRSPEHEGGPRMIGSRIRNAEARRLMIDEVFSSEDETITEPALQAIIEIIARGEENHSDFFFQAFYPLLKEAGKLPHFAKELVDTLVLAEHDGIDLFEIRSEREFFEETRKIIRLLAAESPELREDITDHLHLLAGERTEEVPLVIGLVGDFSRGTPLEEIKKIRPLEFSI
ncbi:MAG: hypothetical protein HQ547_03070 [Candidatus Omnitrophica bacterium]|nr:hypothetical protein [Candidatus Omnitrophota bacterium]